MASIQVRKETGCLILDFYYRSIRCREHTALTDTASNRKRLEKLLTRIEEEISLGTFDYARYFPTSKVAKKFAQSPMTDAVKSLGIVVAGGDVPINSGAGYGPDAPLFKEFAEIWLSEKQVEWRQSYQTSIKEVLDMHLIPKFGDQMVSRITKADVLAFRAQLAKVPARGKTTTLSNSRLNRILNPLRQILNEAADRFDFRTPFMSLKQLKVKKSDVQPFALDEVRRIIDTVRKDYRYYYIARFFTGMRTGEVDGLKWKYVDFERRIIMVRETIVMGREEYTKTDASQRDIQMSQIVHDALKEQEKATRHLSAYVFVNRNGTTLDHKNVTNRVWYPLLRHLGLIPRRPYQTRHTAATLWLAAGENPEWIARQMGHSTTEMLFRVYSRFVPNLTRRDGSAFERLLTGVLGDGTRQIHLDPVNPTESEVNHA